MCTLIHIYVQFYYDILLNFDVGFIYHQCINIFFAYYYGVVP